MKYTYFFITIILFCSLQSFAQIITGNVYQSDGKPLEYATVTLNRAGDSSLVTGTITGSSGDYELRGVKPGKYYVKASMIGMNTTKSEVFDFKGESKTLDKLTVSESSQQLSQVTITAKRPVIEVKADKTILNVENTISSTGLTAFELLRKAPGVMIDNNDNISVKGKNGVKIMIDNREVPLDTKDLAMQLKGMPSSEIAAIEIITNPSARYDASGSAGIINIRLKKNKNYGTNGNAGIEMIQGVTPKAGINASLNHREEKFNINGSYNNHYGIWHNSQDYTREQNGYYFDQDANTEFISRWNSAKVGFDWFVNPKNTLGVIVNGNINPCDWNSRNGTLISHLSSPEVIDSTIQTQNNIGNQRDNLSANLNYTYADTNGRRFSIDLNQGLYRLNSNSLQTSTYYRQEGPVIINSLAYHSQTPTNIDMTTLNSDWEQKLWKGTFSAGVKFARVSTDNTYNFYNIIEGSEVLDNNVSNSFDYHEAINAGYVNYNTQLGKFNLQAGLRVENTDFKGVLQSATQQNGEEVKGNYTEYFPSFALTYMFNDKLGLNGTYSRRIDRPSYQDLNPFKFKLDDMTYEKGNPLLKPQFTNSYELNTMIMGQPILKFGYSQTRDLFSQIIDTADHNASYVTMENIADLENFSIGINIPTPIKKWWEGFISLTGYMSRFEAEIRKDFKVKDEFKAFSLYVEQTFRLPKGYSIQASGWYNSKTLNGTMENDPMGAMDLAVQKKVLNDKGEIKLRFGDVLNTAQWKMTNRFTPGLSMKGNGTWESRTVTLNFSYRFGNNQIKAGRQRRTGLEDESGRVKSGRN